MKNINIQFVKKISFLVFLTFLLNKSTFSQNNYSINLGLNCSESGTNTSPAINFGDVLDMNSSFSVGGWYYASSSCDQHLTFASKKEITSGYQGWEIGYNNDNNELVFSVRQGSVNERIETNNFSFDQWVHVVGVFESNSLHH